MRKKNNIPICFGSTPPHYLATAYKDKRMPNGVMLSICTLQPDKIEKCGIIDEDIPFEELADKEMCKLFFSSTESIDALVSILLVAKSMLDISDNKE